MADLLLDAQGDLDLTGGDLNLVRDASEVAQRILLALGMVQGEWFLDTRKGFPWFAWIGRKGDAARTGLEGALRTFIQRIPGVRLLASLVVTYPDSTRRATVTFQAVADDGTVLEPTTLEAPF